jgi:hypothetical protein
MPRDSFLTLPPDSDRNEKRFYENCLSCQAKSTTLAKQYLKEALKSYEQDCFLASSVMLGVAAEDTTLDVAASFVAWQGKPAENLKTILENPKGLVSAASCIKRRGVVTAMS